MNKIFLSSTGSGEISLTIKGLAILLLPIAIQYANNHGVVITQDTVMQGVASVTAIIGQIALCIGLLRKFLNWARLLMKPAAEA